MTISRRNFIRRTGLGALGAAPLGALASAVVADILRGSRALAETGVSERSYVNINFGGGPGRYQFDHWLKSHPDDPEIALSAHNSTAFNYDGAGNVVIGEQGQHTRYLTQEFRGYHVPQLFFTFSEAERTRFLDQFLVIQGYGTGIDSHGINTNLQMHPLSSAPSITGLVADHSERVFQAVQYGGSRSFLAGTGVSVNNLKGLTPLSQMLGVATARSNTRSLIDEHLSIFAEARAALAAATEPSTAARAAEAALDRGYALLDGSATDFASQWPGLVAKYDAVVHDAMRSLDLPGITRSLDGSQPLSFPVFPDDGRFDDGGRGGYLRVGSNLVQLAEHATHPIGRRLALVEYCIKNKLVSGFQMSGDTGTEGLNLSPGEGVNLFEIGNDYHGCGGFIAMMAMTAKWRAVMAGLLLLKEELTASGDWSNTVVHLTSEFDRSINAAGTGANHGTEQMVSSVFSGVFGGGPYVVGNMTTPEADGLRASQGHAAPLDGTSTRPTPLLVASTLCELLGYDNPWQNFQTPGVRLGTDGQLAYAFGRGKVTVR